MDDNHHVRPLVVVRLRQMGVEFMEQSNQTVNDILRDGNYACDTASNP